MRIEEFGDLSEYVENQELVLKILEGYDFDIIFNGIKEFDRQSYYNYQFIITNLKTENDHEQSGVGVPNDHYFDYSEGIGNDILDESNKLNKIINALWCIISDFMCYYMDFDEFVDTFGYGSEEVNKVRKIWKDIKYNNDMLLDLMNENDIEILRDNIQL